jgi:hypothetical protein
VFLCLYLDRGQGCAWIDDEAAPKMRRSGGGFPEEVVVLRAEFGGSSPSAQNDRQSKKQKAKAKAKAKADPLWG